MEEDLLITQSIAELGHKWNQIAERLPGRTEHAIRNRWHRLLQMQKNQAPAQQAPPFATATLEELSELSANPMGALNLQEFIDEPE